MSDPVDARVLRMMVREAATEEVEAPDWDALEERLLARLDEPPSALSKAMLDATPEDVGDDEEEESAERALPSLDGALEDVPTREVATKEATAKESAAILHFVGGSSDEFDPESEAIESVHSPSLIHEPPRRRANGRAEASPSGARRWAAVSAIVSIAACATFFLAGGSKLLHVETDDGRTAGLTEAPITAEHWVDPASVPMAPGLDNVRDLSALHAGDVVEATQGAVTFGQKDQLTWTLSPGTRVVVRSGIEATSLRHVLVLENGSIRADVTTMGFTALDPFVVEAGDTRVTADKTRFSVTRSSRGIVVDVEDGSAIVGPREELGLGTGRIVEAPRRASMTLDGSREFKLLDPVRASVDPSQSPDNGGWGSGGAVLAHPTDRTTDRSTTPDARRTDVPVDRPPSATPPNDTKQDATPAAAPPLEVTLDAGTIRAMLNGCFADVEAKRKAASDGGNSVSTSVHSTLHLGISDTGTIANAAFAPPLRPDLQACAAPLLRKKIVGASKVLDLPIDIQR